MKRWVTAERESRYLCLNAVLCRLSRVITWPIGDACRSWDEKLKNFPCFSLILSRRDLRLGATAMRGFRLNCGCAAWFSSWGET